MQVVPQTVIHGIHGQKLGDRCDPAHADSQRPPRRPTIGPVTADRRAPAYRSEGAIRFVHTYPGESAVWRDADGA